MGSVSDYYKCPLCGRVGNGGYHVDGLNVGPICQGSEEVRYSCLDRILDGETPNQIIGNALEKILKNLKIEDPGLLAQLVAPWAVNCG